MYNSQTFCQCRFSVKLTGAASGELGGGKVELSAISAD